MRGIKRFCLSCLILPVFCSSGFAQGKLMGVVMDSLTNDVLPGANVTLSGTSIGASTDLEGEYYISSVPEGSYDLQVQYIGYVSKIQKIELQKGETKIVNMVLIPGIIQGEVISITVQALGQTAAINQQVRSNTIVNVVSEEKIQELPDANAAEAVGRLPGVALTRSGGEASKVVLRGLSASYSNVMIDGVRMATTGSDERSMPSDPRSSSTLSVSSNSRNVDLSVVSQRTLAGIELYKALTSDMDADAIAGAINLVTRKAPSERNIRADMRGSYNDLDNSYNQYDFALKYGERFFSDKLGVQATGNLEQRIRSNEEYDMDNNLSAGSTGETWEVTGAELTYSDEIRKRDGFGLLLDYDTPDGGWIKLNTIYSKTKRDFLTNARNYPLDDEVYYHYRDREEEILTFNSFIRGENRLYGFGIDWNFSYASSSSSFPYDYDMWFNEPSTLEGDSVVSAMRPCPYDKGPLEAIIPYACNNFAKTSLFSAYYREQESEELEKSGFLDVGKEYVLGTMFSGKLKFGIKYRDKSRTRSRSELFSPYYNFPLPMFTKLSDGTVVPKDFTGTRFENLERYGGTGSVLFTNFLPENPENRSLFEKYDMYPLIDRDALRDWYALNKNGIVNASGTGRSEYLRNKEPDATFYDLTERVSAAYLMNTLNYKQNITFIAGLRVESENNDYSAKFSPTELQGYPVPDGQIQDTSAVHDETVLLPNFHLTVRPTDFLSVRLAAYKALARPDFNQRLPNFIARTASYFYSGNALVIGNPGLEAARAWNYEVNTSVYESTYGLFSLSAFFKDIEGMYHLMNGISFSGSRADYGLDSLGIGWDNPWPGVAFSLVYPINSKKPTRVWGFEAEVQTSSRFISDFFPGIPRYFNNFVFNGNVSIVRSETWIPGTDLEIYPISRPPFQAVRTVYVERKQKLEDQPEFFSNFAIGYDIGGFSARISYFYQGEYFRTLSPNKKSDTIQNSFSKWDLALKYGFNKYLEIFLNVNNITNVEESTTNINRVENWRLINRSQIYGRTADLGIRVSL